LIIYVRQDKLYIIRVKCACAVTDPLPLWRDDENIVEGEGHQQSRYLWISP